MMSDKYVDDVPTKSGRNCLMRAAHFVVIAFLIAGAVVGLSVAFTGSPNPVDYFIPVDPPGANEAIRWDAEQGLSLLIENACDDTWTEEFDVSVSEWNATEALILSTRRDFYDYDCSAAFGKLRVCNGDYGNTDWKGINIVFMQYDRIVHSVSKLNDYHLKTPVQRRYTMCHELGHGFGLPHTDENHFNRDRGDCMDYTDSPRNNLVPGSFNLNLLVDLYGTPTQPRVETTDAPPASSAAENNSNSGNGDNNHPPMDVFENEDNKKEEEEEDEDDRRRVLRFLRSEDDEDEDDEDEDDDEDDEDSSDGDMLPNYQRLTRRAEKACKDQICSFDVGRGFLIHVLKLRA